jgi:hypothetical protein
MALPTLTPEQRERALARAHEANQARKEALGLLKTGVLTIGDVLDGQVEALAKMKVRSLLLALPRIGAVKADAIMTAAGVAEKRRVSGLTNGQRVKLAHLIAGG